MFRRILLFAVGAVLLSPSLASAAEDAETLKVLAQYKPVLDKGLEWIRKQQKRDGSWDAHGGQHQVAMTALAGMALLAEGSTPSQGRYAKELDNAVEYLINKSQRNGMIGNPKDEQDRHRYMYGHGFSLMFLACVYGEEQDDRRRKELEKVLTRAVEFTAKAQTRLGGFGYVSAADGNHFDEGSVTVTQLQALRAARNAGIPVPKKVIEDSQEYLKKSTRVAPNGNHSDPKKRKAGVIYSLQNGGGDVRPPLTAAGLCCLFSAGDYDSETVVQWINFCQEVIPIDKSGRDSFGHWEYTHVYYAQAMYVLGEDRHAKMRPDLADDKLLKWSRYRKITFEFLKERQNPDGSWNSGVGPIFATALHCIILQLDKGNVPLYQR